eukprot:6047551-Amphidinium_carterae.2
MSRPSANEDRSDQGKKGKSKGRTLKDKRKGLARGPVYQLDATNSEHPPVPSESGTGMMDQSATQQSQSSGQVAGHRIQAQSSQTSLEPWIEGTKSRMTTAAKLLVNHSGVRRCCQKLSFMYDACAAVSVAYQSIIDADFKRCTIMSGGIGLR